MKAHTRRNKKLNSLHALAMAPNSTNENETNLKKKLQLMQKQQKGEK